MKTTLALIFTALFGTVSAFAAVPLAELPEDKTPVVSSGALSLNDVYQRALTVSETLPLSDQEIEIISSQYQNGVGAALPSLSWKMTQFWQDTTGVNSGTGNDATSTQLRKRRPESYFELLQPIFHGFREFNAVRGFSSAKKAAEYERRQATLNMLNDVANLFYTSLNLQGEIDVLTSQRSLTVDRVQELERRVRLGRSRESEILSAQVELASIDAQIEDSRQRWSVARQTLWFFTRIDPQSPLQETRPLPTLPDLQTSVDRSANRPDLLAAEQRRRQREMMVTYAKGGYWPLLDFTGRYYTERVGFNKEVDWDMELALEVPIFQGMQNRAAVREARARLLIAQLERSRLERQVVQETNTAHQNLGYSLSQNRFYDKAVEMAERNYKIQIQEYRLGLINNLQVFDVLKTLQDMKIQKLRAEAATRINEIRLMTATGRGL